MSKTIQKITHDDGTITRIKTHSERESERGASMGFFYQLENNDTILYTSGYFMTAKECLNSTGIGWRIVSDRQERLKELQS